MTVDAKKIEKGDLMAFVYWGTVNNTNQYGDSISVMDIDREETFFVNGVSLVESSFSADRWDKSEKVTKTKAAEILIASHNKPFTVVFKKADGSERTLRGRLVKPEPLLGRSMVEDLDVDREQHCLRQVDHRTIKSLIVDNVMYVVK